MTAPAPRHARHVRHARLAAVGDVLAVAALPVVEWFDDHVAAPFAKWRADRTGWEKAAAAVRASILLGVLVGAVIALAGCDRTVGELPGHGTAPSAVKIADGIDLDTCEMARILDVDPVALAATLRTAS